MDSDAALQPRSYLYFSIIFFASDLRGKKGWDGDDWGGARLLWGAGQLQARRSFISATP